MSPSKEILSLMGLSAGCVFSIIVYGTFRCRNAWFQDPLTKSPVGEEHPLHPFLDGWALLHFWFFALLTFLFSRQWRLIVGIGIVWEFIEMKFKEKPFYLTECDISLSDEKDGWWYGRWQDIVTNTLGMLFGYYIFRGRVRVSAFVCMLFGILAIYTFIL